MNKKDDKFSWEYFLKWHNKFHNKDQILKNGKLVDKEKY